MRILVVDDNKLIRTILAKLLESFGNVVCAKSGEEGLAAFKESFEQGNEPYSIVCMDMSMGAGMSGDEAVAEMRAFETQAPLGPRGQTKIIMVTAFADRESVMKTREFCDGYILKPIVKEKLYERLESFGFYANLTAPPPPPPEPEPKGLKGSSDATEIEAKANLSAWERAPLLALRAGLLVALVPKREKPEDLPSFKMTQLDNVEFFASVKPFSLAALAEDSNLELKCGEGMAYLPKLKAFVTRIGGRVFVENGVIDVNPLLEIENGLRFKNIDFAGRLRVHGDVADGLAVSADEGVEIDGDVGSCKIFSKGDVYLHRFNGRGSGLIECEGSLKAEYIYDSTVRVKGDIAVVGESVNSVLCCMGALRAGTILGKSCTAFMSIELARAGSPKEIPTKLRAGFSFIDERKADELRASLAQIDLEIAQLEQMLGPHANDFRAAFKLPEKQMERIFELAGRRLLLKYNERPDLETAVMNAQTNVGKFPAAKICVEETLCKGVSLEIGDKVESFPHECYGPICVTTISDDARYFLERN